MNGITEAAVYEAFGLGEQVQAVAEPATEVQQPTGEQVQEVAAPAGADDPQSDNHTEPEESPEQQQTPGADGKNLTPEQRRQNAEIRRQREREAQQAATQQAVQEAIQQERQRTDEQLAAVFAGMNLRNSVTGEPITTMEQFHEWQKQQRAEQLQRDLKAGKLTPEGLQGAIGDHPVVQQAQQLIQSNATQAEQTAKAQARAQIEADIAEIGKLDASITSLEDLMNAPYWNDLYAMTKRGYSIKDAHFLLNHKRLEEAKLEAARAAGANNARGKDHMTGLAPTRGGGNLSVPADELAVFRAFNPNATDAEIQAFYNNYMKK